MPRNSKLQGETCDLQRPEQDQEAPILMMQPYDSFGGSKCAQGSSDVHCLDATYTARMVDIHLTNAAAGTVSLCGPRAA